MMTNTSNNDKNNGDDDAMQGKYDKLRDDQMNTGIIAALVGGFALANSWEINLEGGMMMIIAYSLSIMAVQTCTCAALVSAFLYRNLTMQPTFRKGVEWIERHSVLAVLPWYKFLVGTLCFVVSVCLISWRVLVISMGARTIVIIVGVSSCCLVIYTLLVVQMDYDPEDADKSKKSDTKWNKN